MAQLFFHLPCMAAATIALVAVSSVPAPAAGNGVAYDSVQKFGLGSSASATPGTFASDFATASTTAASTSVKRGLFGLGSALAAASGALAMVKSGTAEHYYSAGAKQRVDTIATGEARIVDCSARTLTTLDLNKKTYTVVSLDRPDDFASPDPKHHDHNAPEPAASDDGTKVTLNVTTKALGQLPIGGVPTSGYATRMKMTTTKPTGESQTVDSDMTSYLSTFAEPREDCPEAASRLRTRAGGSNGAAMGQFLLAMKAMKTPKSDPRFTITSSGAPMPSGKLALWQQMTFGQGGNFAILIERGNVRSIAESDPVFGIPPGFTQSP